MGGLVSFLVMAGIFAMTAWIKSVEQQSKRSQELGRENQQVRQARKQFQKMQKTYEEQQKNFEQEQDRRGQEEKAERAKQLREEEKERGKNSRHHKPSKEIIFGRESKHRNLGPTITPEILKRAEDQTTEDFTSDEMVIQAQKEQECSSGVHSPVEKKALLDQVKDLMIMGPDSAMSYERDFIGEAADMLYQYEQIS